MTVLRSLFVLLVCMVTAVRAGDAVPVVHLESDIVVTDADVRWIDLARGPLDAAFGHTIVFKAPAPGRERSWSRQQILREAVRRGLPVVPSLAGSERVRVRRRGGAVAPDAIARRLHALLQTESLPPGGIAQSFEVLRVPTMNTVGGLADVEIDGEIPHVGRGSVAVRLRASDGSTRRAYAMVERSVLMPVVRTRRALDAGTVITLAKARIDSVWVDDVALFDRRIDPAGIDGRHSLLRRTRGGSVLRSNDVRPTPVVRRGELVQWVVERDGLRIEVRARARQDGAIGDWISVLGPFDRHQRRVVVIAPGRVANHARLEDQRGDS